MYMETLPNSSVTVPQINETSILIQNLLQFEMNKAITGVKLGEKEQQIIQFILINSPESLINIKTCILEIIKDGKIDAADIPQFIQLIKYVYILCYQDNKIQLNISDIASTVGSIVKYVIHIVLDKYNIKNPELVICCDSLVNICVEMIDLQSSLITKTCFPKFC